uniref:Uncharacterized protein n=1 Tax=Rhizophora mucronata TaxID=61149 RepID=A0A2P2PHW2_RHIMU
MCPISTRSTKQIANL